jgi:mono/diheme cytochrome c family protein
MTTSAFGGGGPTPGMPGLRLTTDEVEAIVAYLLEQPSG